MIKQTGKTENLRIAVPSEGALYDSTMSFMKSAGIEIRRSNARSYEASISEIPNAIVHFQRSGDIPLKIEEASADIGIVGYDRYLETKKHPGNSSVIINNLGFGHAQLVLGLPDTWVDIADIKDLAKTIHQFTNSKSDLQIGALKNRPTEIWRMCADNSRSKTIFDWQPDILFEDGLKITIEWRENPALVLDLFMEHVSEINTKLDHETL